MRVRVDAAGDDQHALGVDLACAGRCGQVPTDLGDGSVANAQIALGPSDRGDEKAVADDDLWRLLRTRAYDRRDCEARQSSTDAPASAIGARSNPSACSVLISQSHFVPGVGSAVLGATFGTISFS